MAGSLISLTLAALIACAGRAVPDPAESSESSTSPKARMVRAFVRVLGPNAEEVVPKARVFVVSHRGAIIAEAQTDQDGMALLPELGDAEQPWLVIAEPPLPKPGTATGGFLGKGVIYWSSGLQQVCIDVPSQASCDISVIEPPGAAEEGGSCDNPVVVAARNQNEGITEELRWIAGHFPKGRVVRQVLGRCGDRPVDILEIRTAEGGSRKLYFDIRAYFGK